MGEGGRDEEVASSKKNWIEDSECKNRYPIYDQNGGKMLKLIPYLWPKWLKNHTLWGCTYLCSPYKGVLRPPGFWVYSFFYLKIYFRSLWQWPVSHAYTPARFQRFSLLFYPIKFNPTNWKQVTEKIWNLEFIFENSFKWMLQCIYVYWRSDSLGILVMRD